MDMQLAKDCLDVGLFTNNLDAMREFYGDRLKLPYEEVLPLGGGLKQHRYGLLGSVLKLNHSRDPFPSGIAGGYARLSIAHGAATESSSMSDPDGNPIELVPSGHNGIDQIGIHLRVTDEDEFARFYAEVMGAEQIASRRFRIGRTVVSFARDAVAKRAHRDDPRSPAEVIASMRAQGFRYMTVQVRDCDATFTHAVAHGAWEGSRPVTLGEVARICFIRDPDGNWIEISQRASLTGPLPRD